MRRNVEKRIRNACFMEGACSAGSGVNLPVFMKMEDKLLARFKIYCGYLKIIMRTTLYSRPVIIVVNEP